METFYHCATSYRKISSFVKQIIVTKYLKILMTNFLSIPILYRTIDDSRIDILYTLETEDYGSQRDWFRQYLPSVPNTRHPIDDQSSTWGTDRWTYEHDFFPTLQWEFSLETASKANFPAFFFWYYYRAYGI